MEGDISVGGGIGEGCLKHVDVIMNTRSAFADSLRDVLLLRLQDDYP